MALKIFEQQAMAIGRMFTIAANFTDPDAYFVGGGVVETEPHFRDWFIAKVQQFTLLREEQALAANFKYRLRISIWQRLAAPVYAALQAIRPGFAFPSL